jgi:glycosyltransferase involved in cell wall biosynthesis
MNKLKVNIFHEWVDNIGGGEFVIMCLREIFPESTIYALWEDEDVSKNYFDKIETSFLQYFPKKLRRNVGLVFMPFAWITLAKRAKSADINFASSWVFAHMIGRYSKSGTNFNYIHTPCRYWWFSKIDDRMNFVFGSLVQSIFKKFDYYFTKQKSVLIANSSNTQNRIRIAWDLPSEVIYPPVDIEFYDFKLANKIEHVNYLLCVGRFVSYKGQGIAIDLAEKLGLPLVIAGHGPNLGMLQNRAIKSKFPVYFEVNPTKERLRDLYSNAKCLVYPAIEDFGIVPVEAMACGLPVLGLAAGGLLETVSVPTAGYLVDSNNLETLENGYLNLNHGNKESIRSTIFAFSKNNFQKNILNLVNSEKKFD